jgi:hypothetical protein
MYSRASRWAKASEAERIRRMAELETIVESAISLLETEQIIRPSPIRAQRLNEWRAWIQEAPARRAG